MIDTLKLSENRWAVVAGTVEYLPGRDYPWQGMNGNLHGGIAMCFATRAEAEHFALTGQKPKPPEEKSFILTVKPFQN